MIALVSGCNLKERAEKAIENSNVRLVNVSNTKNDINANKTLSEKAADAVLEEKIGIAECDELIDIYAEQDKTDGEGYFKKARRTFYKNTIRQELKKNIEKNKNNKKALAATCLQLKEQLENFKPEANTD